MSIGIDEGDGYSYGYPKMEFVGREGWIKKQGWLRISQGWFLPELEENEPACYLDLYILGPQEGFILLDYFWSSISFQLFQGMISKQRTLEKIREDFEGRERVWLMGEIDQKHYEGMKEIYQAVMEILEGFQEES